MTSPSSQPKRILVVEDDRDSAEVMDAYLRRDGFLVAIAADGEHALELFSHWRPDLVLLDIMLPRRSGIEVLAVVREACDTPVIMVTAVADEPEKLGALRYGADDYILKPYNPREVVARVHAVLRRTEAAPRGAGLFHCGSLTIDPSAVQATVRVADASSSVALELTPAEFAILQALARSPFRAFTRRELLGLPDSSTELMGRVVDSHVHSIRRKLAEVGVTGVLVTVRGVGYRYQ